MFFYPLKPHNGGPSYGVCLLVTSGLVLRFLSQFEGLLVVVYFH